MFPKRFAIIALIALLVVALFVVPGIQRDAWLQGYLAGQATAQDGGKVAPLTPYLYPGYAGQGYGPHFGGLGFVLLLGLGLFFFFGVGRHLMWRHWRDYGGPGGPGGPGRRYGGYRHAPWWGEEGPGEERGEPRSEPSAGEGDRPAGGETGRF